ncbi:MAG: glycosyltransferase family 4 protein [Butyrivibrio sp.]|nr:glycosyltransferase family 4 protein [Butyrivibrio sp.]
MKVLHIGIASHFTDKMLYQDNILSDFNAKAGHDVTYISDCYLYRDGALTETEECDCVLDNGVRLIRVRYDRVLNGFITRKIQKAKKIVELLNEISPDTILYHGVCGYELMDVAKYVKEKGIPFYIDSHESFQNTAMTPISKFAYKYIHGFFVRKALPVARKILYVGDAEREYLEEMYNISDDMLEYYPLGGILLDEEKQKKYRKRFIQDMHFPENVIVCTHSGKMDKGKKTEEVIKAFSKVDDNRLRLLIYGRIPDEMKDTLYPLIEADERISFLGWKNASEQEEILGATDIYIQPGTYSATAQIALCDGCAVILNRGYMRAMEDAAFYEEDAEGIEKVIRTITEDDNKLLIAKQKCAELAARRFDYKKMSDRYLK